MSTQFAKSTLIIIINFPPAKPSTRRICENYEANDNGTYLGNNYYVYWFNTTARLNNNIGIYSKKLH